MPKQPALIYHWWNDKPINVWEDWQNPVLLSIASIRAHNPTIPIYVLDISNIERSWDDFPHRLNFKHIKTTPHIPIQHTHEIVTSCYKVCSRQFDIEWLSPRIKEDVLISVESDFMWMRDVPALDDPLDRFYFNFYNSGYYLYDKRDEMAEEFRKWWKHYILLGLGNAKIREQLMSKYEWPYFQDECVMVWLVKSQGGMCADVPNCNVLYDPKKKWEANYKDAVNLHLIGAFFPKNRALLYLLVKEFWDVVSKSLDVDQLYQIFGPDYLSVAGAYASDDMADVNLAMIRLGKDFRLRGVRKLF